MKHVTPGFCGREAWLCSKLKKKAGGDWPMSACLASERQGGHCVKGRNLFNDQNTEAYNASGLAENRLITRAGASKFISAAGSRSRSPAPLALDLAYNAIGDPARGLVTFGQESAKNKRLESRQREPYATTGKRGRTLEVAPSSADPGGMSASLQSHELFKTPYAATGTRASWRLRALARPSARRRLSRLSPPACYYDYVAV